LTKPIDLHRLLDAVAAALPNPSPDRPTFDALEKDPEPLVSTLPMDDRDFREIVDEFAERLEEKMDALRASFERGDYSEVVMIAHWIKGAGGTAGFPALTEPATGLERLARAGATERIESAIQKLAALALRIHMPVTQC
jgi:HPt (histidine-containing phosphotransfer) domain-containing protein